MLLVVADQGGVKGHMPLSVFKFFQFHAVFGKNNRFSPSPWKLLQLPPHLGNPGSATGQEKISSQNY